MPHTARDTARGLDSLRAAVVHALMAEALPPGAGAAGGSILLAEADTRAPVDRAPDQAPVAGASGGGGYDDAERAASSEDSEADRQRLIALVELARGGDTEAFGMLYDHYHAQVYRFLYYKTHSVALAEDLTGDTFFRALRSMTSFRWQGKDFGAWLMTIARNLATDHFKAGRTRLEYATEDMGQHDDTAEGPEKAVLTSITHEMLREALQELPHEQRDCLIMRFLQGMSIADTAAVLGRSDGAVKQLQLRGVRNLAKLMPEGIRDR